MRRTPLCLLAFFSLFAVPAVSALGQGRPDGPPRMRGKNAEKKNGIKPYDEVIPEDAETQRGVFLVHRVKDKLFYEIPEPELGREFLWVVQIAKTGAGRGYGGTPVTNRVVRWELKGEKILLRDVKYTIRAETRDSVSRAVEASSVAPIIRALPVKAWGKDKAPVVEVTSLFTSDVSEFSAARRLGASGMDKDRTFLESVKVFPTNIETKVLATFRGSSGNRGSGQNPMRRFFGSSGGDVTALIHHSMVRLPENPMRPRRYDRRVGFFTVSFQDYASDKHQVEEVRYITRWRLEKKDPKADVSEPKKPIVFYVGREVPDKWKPWIKKGIEAWQPAFEAAGFKNAIIAKDAPSEREDPDWDAEDARYSTIRWLPSTIENAMGPHVHDPRTGEILEADILVYHNILKLVRDWYFVQASPNDPRAQKLPLPDDLVGELLAYVISHEVGHSLGFPHNMKASSAFTVEQLRDPIFTEKYGTEASIMDYGRFNYVAQPGDGARLIPKVGPYDYFAVEWGYREFPEAKTWEQEKAELEKIVKRQVNDPTLRFGDPNPMLDPTQQTEDLGSDPIAATELGLRNIDRVAGYLVEATCKPGEDYSLLENMYGELLGQRNRELMHVVAVVGGVVEQRLWYGDADAVYVPVEAERQREAVRFLLEHGFTVPRSLIDPSILDRIQPAGAPDRMLSSFRQLLGGLIQESRIDRMAEFAERGDVEAYPPAEMLADLRRGIWSELSAPEVRVDLYRRSLQRAHVEALARHVKNLDVDSDLPALCRAELEAILAEIHGAKARAADAETRAHLADLAERIDRELEPRSVRRLEKPVAEAAR